MVFSTAYRNAGFKVHSRSPLPLLYCFTNRFLYSVQCI